MKACLLCLLLLPLIAFAQETGHSKVLRRIEQIRVNEDLSFDDEIDFEYKVLTEQGVRQEGRLPLSYDKSRSELEILLAETVKPDGRRIPVPASGIARQSGSLGQLNFKDLEMVSLAWPELAPGDSVHVKYRIRSQALLPGSFAFAYTPRQNVVQDLLETHLDVPAGMTLKLENLGFTPLYDNTADGRRKIGWRHAVSTVKSPEPNQTEARLSNPHLWVSSFDSWNAMARTYAALYRPQAAVTPEIEALARELTAGAGSEREKVQRLYDWVRKNIRYVAIYAGLESWVPHPAAQVLRDRFGDCKDHAVLLDALLKAVGIESSPVLIQSDLASYALPDIAVPQGFFNHMISYVPSLDMYLDSTSQSTEFGRLPEGDQGKEVIRPLLSGVRASTPASAAAQRQIQRTTVVRVGEDGSASVTTTSWFSNDFRSWYAQFRTQRENGKENAWAVEQLTAQKRRGSASLKWLPEKNGWLGFAITQRIENFLPESEIALLDFGHNYTGTGSIFSALDVFETRSRKSSFACQALDLNETVEISLPDNLKLLRLPRDQKLANEVAELKVEYVTKKNAYAMQRSFRWEPGRSGNCQESDWDNWQKTMRQIRSAVKSAVLAYERS